MSGPRYVVRIVKFDCVDESGVDFIGSDEPYWVFTAYDPNGKVHSTRSKVFGDIDSGETRRFQTDGDRNIVWPRKAAVQGAAAPIGLSVQLWEADQGDPDVVAKKTEQAFDLGERAPVVGTWVSLVPSIVRDQLADFIGDDLMGSVTLHFPAHRLERQLPRPGASLTKKVRLGGRSGDLPFEIAGGPDYDLHIRCTRVA
jgi:hypothetical protein